MKFAELKDKSIAELKELIAAEERRLSEFSFQASTHTLKQVHLIRSTRQLLARLKTALHSRSST